MPRSRVLRGVPVPRSRAQTRRREAIAADAPPKSAIDELAAWMKQNIRTDIELAAVESFDITGFLRSTAGIELAPAERARRLAIYFERDCGIGPWAGYRAWLAMERVFDQASELEPGSSSVLASKAVTAMDFADLLEPPRSVAMRGRARTFLQQARQGAPDDSYLFYLSGTCEYMDPNGVLSDALEWFEKACSAEPDYAWAQLYRAHCLHDLERWEEAVGAYEAVDTSVFDGPVAWRGEKLREQLAYCKLRAGDELGALRGFERVLNEYEKLPEHRIVDISDIIKAASGPFRNTLAERVAALAERIGLTEDAIQLRTKDG